MATRIAWLLNLDADLELRDPRRSPSVALSAQRIAELSARFCDLVADDDLVLESHAHAHVDGLAPQAFCPTPSALTRIGTLGLSPPPAPAFSILRTVNDRAFCAQLGHGLEGSCFARTTSELDQHLERHASRPLVIKRAFSFAGRDQRRTTPGAKLDDSTRGFCARSFACGEGVQVEPWVERIMDFSIHGHLTPAGALLAGAPRRQRCDPFGRFIATDDGSENLGHSVVARLEAELESTAAALHGAGYFGPFGIDGFTYRADDGTTKLNPRCEINARFTMGFPRSLLMRALDQA